MCSCKATGQRCVPGVVRTWLAGALGARPCGQKPGRAWAAGGIRIKPEGGGPTEAPDTCSSFLCPLCVPRD